MHKTIRTAGTLLTSALLSAVLVSGALADGDDHDHDHDHEHDHDHDHAEVTDLGPWEGDWVSASMYLDGPAGDELVSTIAVNIGAEPDAVRSAMEEQLRTSFDRLSIDGDDVTFSPDGQTFACHYTYDQTVDMVFDGETYHWYNFVTDDDACADQENLIMADAHGEGASFHFHFRYGVGDPQHVMDDEANAGWFPSAFPASLTAEAFAAEMAPADSEFARYLAELLGTGGGTADAHASESPAAPDSGSGELIATGDRGPGALALSGAALIVAAMGMAAVYLRRRSA